MEAIGLLSLVPPASLGGLRSHALRDILAEQSITLFHRLDDTFLSKDLFEPKARPNKIDERLRLAAKVLREVIITFLETLPLSNWDSNDFNDGRFAESFIYRIEECNASVRRLSEVYSRLDSPQSRSKRIRNYPLAIRDSDLQRVVRQLELVQETLVYLIQFSQLKQIGSVEPALGVKELMISNEGFVPRSKTQIEAESHAIFNNWLAIINPEDTQRHFQQRHGPSSGEWLRDTKEFIEWIATPNSLFMITGRPGSGKTILCSTIIDHLNTHQVSLSLLYYFFGFQSQTSSASAFIRSLLFQTIRSQVPSKGDKLNAFMSRYTTAASANVMDLLDLLLSLMKSGGRYSIVVDAFDECSEPEDLLAVTNILSRHPGVHMMIFSRPYSTIEKGLSSQVVYRVNIDKSQTSDIKRFIKHRLEKDERLRRLPRNIKADIDKTLSNDGLSMFLQVHLTLAEFSECQTASDVAKLLEQQREYPLSLFTLYDLNYGRILTVSNDHVRRIMQRALIWVAFSARPMKLEELAEACIIEPDPREIDFSARLLNPGDILHGCAPFLIIHGGAEAGKPNQLRDTVGLVHSSVQYYINMKYRRRQGGPFELKGLIPSGLEASQYIAKACLSYLLKVGRESAPDTVVCDHPFLEYAVENWPFHAQDDGSKELDDLLRKLFSDQKTFDLWLTLSRQKALSTSSEQEAPFLKYAAKIGLERIVKFIIEKDPGLRGSRTVLGGALIGAAVEGHAEVVTTLLEYGADPRFSDGRDNWPITSASSNGHVSAVEALVDAMKQKEDDGDNKIYGKALHIAASAGKTKVIKLLNDKADADINFQDASTGSTPLHVAVQKDREDVYEFLLELGAILDIKDKAGQSPLELAWSKKKLDWSIYTRDDSLSYKLDSFGQASSCDVLRRTSEARKVTTQPFYSDLVSNVEEGSQNTGPYEYIFCKRFKFKDSNEGEKEAADKARRYLLREHNILQKLKHPNIVEYLGFEEDLDHDNKKRASLFLEYCSGGSLQSFVKKRVSRKPPKEKLSETEAWELVFHVAAALAYLHHGLSISSNGVFTFEKHWKRILHRDLKPPNVIFSVRDETRKVAKVCDLGLAKQASVAITGMGATDEYLAPELKKRGQPKIWTIKTDIYALGATVDDLEKTFECPELKKLLGECMEDKDKNRPSSISMLADASTHVRQTLPGLVNSLDSLLGKPLDCLLGKPLDCLPGKHKSEGYLLNAVLILGNWLDDQDSWHLKSTRRRRRSVLKRLRVLCDEDGADDVFDRLGNSLHLAVLLKREDKVKKMVQDNPSLVNDKWQRSEWTALHLACQTEGSEHLQQWLRDAGADDTLEDRHGLLAEDCKKVEKDAISFAWTDCMDDWLANKQKEEMEKIEEEEEEEEEAEEREDENA
ncbi:hypothetical protein F5B21DRAFT_509071 [Xylaria acuta]|nr:hypothetical protein F5B21DRAFT_509071 [Xylaria acuta]